MSCSRCSKFESFGRKDQEVVKISHQIEKFRAQFRLPELEGTDAQRTWATSIRDSFFDELFDDVDQLITGLSQEEECSLVASLEKLRAEARAWVWIERIQEHLGAADDFLRRLPAAEVAAEERRITRTIELKEMQRRSKESNALNKIAVTFDEANGLPPLSGFTIRQQNFGDRCRYQILSQYSADQLTAARNAIDRALDSGFWIGCFLKGPLTLDELRLLLGRNPESLIEEQSGVCEMPVNTTGLAD